MKDNYTPSSYPRHAPAVDPLVYHEAAHAIVAYRLGFAIEFIDMTCLMIPSPVCGMNVEPVPAYERARATGMAAMAGPVGESIATGRPPVWRQDGKVALVSAKALAFDAAAQMNLMIQWAQEVREMLDADPAFLPLVKELDKKQMLTGARIKEIIASTERF